MNSSILPANDCSLTVVGIAPVCMIVFGCIFSFIFLSAFLANKRVHYAFDTGPILSVFPALIVHTELKRVHPGFPVAFIF